MPFSNTPVPPYPNVPPLPGVPFLLRAANTTFFTVAAVAADAALIGRYFAPPQWGLFDQYGNDVIIPDTITNVDFKADKRISTAPQENGAFASYNKVSDPFNARMTMIKSGSLSDRNYFLSLIELAQAALTLYTLVIPEKIYPNVNVVHYDYKRTAQRGLSMLIVDVWIEEVRVTGTSQFTSTAVPNAAAPSNTGSSQPSTTPTAPTGTSNLTPLPPRAGLA